MDRLKIGLIFILLLGLCSQSFAKHISVNVTNKGLVKLLNSAISSYAGKKKNIQHINIEANTVYNRIEKEFFDTNPVIQKVKNLTNFEQDEDFVFYVDWSKINLDAQMIKNSLKVNITEGKRNFTASISMSLNKLILFGDYIALCELKKWKCDPNNAVYGRFNGYKIALDKGEKVDIAAVLDVSISNGKVQVAMKHFLTNLVAPINSTQRQLYKKYNISYRNIANFDISFREFVIPAPKLTINGTTVELDVSRLKDVILSEKNYLSTQLAAFAGDYISNNLTTILNKDFFQKLKDLKTNLSILDYQSDMLAKNDEEDIEADYQLRNVHVADNTYVVQNHTAEYFQYLDRLNQDETNPSFMEEFLKVLKRFIYHARFDLTYDKAQTYKEKDLNVEFNSTLRVNNKKWRLSEDIKNGKAKLKDPQFYEMGSNYDVAVALSESIINGALSLSIKDGIVQGLFDSYLSAPGVNISNLALHFEEGNQKTYKLYNPLLQKFESTSSKNSTTNSTFKPYRYYDKTTGGYKTVTYRSKDAVVAVAVIVVDMWKQESDGILSWIENTVGAVMEKGYIWFPIEIKLYPQIVKDEKGNSSLELYASDPFSYKGLRNTYDYPYKDMKNIVHEGLLSKLKEMLKPLSAEIPSIDLSSYLSFQGIKLDPVKVYLKNTGHIVITTNVDELDLKKLSEAEESAQ